MKFEIGSTPDGTLVLRFTDESVRNEIALSPENAATLAQMVTDKLAERAEADAEADALSDELDARDLARARAHFYGPHNRERNP